MQAFISYAHSDEKYLERLHKHLAMLLREGALTAWFDRAILPGSTLNQEIRDALDNSELFIALVSPDFLASNYCYEIEFNSALERAAAGKLKIVPVILEPCDWPHSPLSQFLVLPKDGKAVAEWTNPNNAYLDIVNGLRRVIVASEPKMSKAFEVELGSTKKLKLKRDFDTIDKSDFADRAFQTICDYFRQACAEIEQAADDIKTRFAMMSDASFTCSVVNRAKRNAESHITVFNQKSRRMGGEMSYSYEPYADGNSSNGFIRVVADEYNLYLNLDMWGFGGGAEREESRLTPDQVAERMWKDFVERAGVDYE